MLEQGHWKASSSSYASTGLPGTTGATCTLSLVPRFKHGDSLLEAILCMGPRLGAEFLGVETIPGCSEARRGEVSECA